MNSSIDYIVVGQGLAGTLLTYFLQKKGKKVVVIDNEHHGAASKIAAGVINPITGRRYVKSWKIEELLPFAAATYPQLEQELGIQFYHPSPIVRALFNHREQEDWDIRNGEAAYQKYMLATPDLGRYASTTKLAYAYGEVAQSAQVKVGKLITTYRQKLLENGNLLSEKFDFEQIQMKPDSIVYKGFEAKKIIFCEGQQATQNPFFNYLPFQTTKGEVLIVRIPEAGFKRMLKQRIFIVPLQDDLYWVGSTNEWEYDNENPTAEAKKFLLDRLKDLLLLPFEVLEHRAAIRPTVKDRRPFLGVHPNFPTLAIFNGLGAKGASLGPYFAQHFVDYLIGEQALMKEANIMRFE